MTSSVSHAHNIRRLAPSSAGQGYTDLSDDLQTSLFFNDLGPQSRIPTVAPSASKARMSYNPTNYSKPSSSPTIVAAPIFIPHYRRFPRPSLHPSRSSMKKSNSDSSPNVPQRPSAPSKLSWLSRRGRDSPARHVTFLFPDGHRERARPPRTITSSISTALASMRKFVVQSLGLDSYMTWTKSAGPRGHDVRPELGFHQWSVDADDVIPLYTPRSQRMSHVGSQSYLDLGDRVRNGFFD